MKKLQSCLCIIAVLLLMVSCNQKAGSDKSSSDKAAETKGIQIKLTQLATTKDVVCGMPVEEGSVGDTASYGGKLYAFCSSDCKAQFLKNPESYLNQK
jgi:YHS domain-containing protein